MEHVIEQRSFWRKVRRFAGKLPFVADVVALHYCMLDPATPFRAKAQIGFAIAYFVSPVDAIPDVLPIIGFTDDATVIATTLLLVKTHVTEEHRRKARAILDA